MPSRHHFRFADATCDSLGAVIFLLHTHIGAPNIPVDMDIVSAEIPPLLGLDILDRQSLTPCTVSNRLVKRNRHYKLDGIHTSVDEWFVQMKRSAKNLFSAPIHFLTYTYFSKMQLSRLHRQFFHPSASKLLDLIKNYRTEEATPQSFKTSEDVSRRCGPCQRIQGSQ